MGVWKPFQQARAGLGLARLRKLDRHDPARAPRNAAFPDRGVEEREAVCGHDRAKW